MSSEPGTAKGTTEIVEPSRAQQQLARRVAESRATIPDLTLGSVVDLEAALARAGAATPRDLVLRAAALALREQPAVNAAYRDGRYERYSRVNVAFVVDTGAAVVTPTIFDADAKPLAEIAAEAADLSARAAELRAPQTGGATCTVTEVDGVGRVVPPLSQPQAVALGVGAVSTRALVRDAAVVAAPGIELTLVCDHRIVYGRLAATFLARVVALLEDPAGL
jgi:pyruvate dehydrogenase E2 component (dihydrolipoamide acetyltransferase)